MESVVIIGGNCLAFELIKILKKKYKVYYLVRKKKKIRHSQKVIKFNAKEIIKNLNKIKPIILINLVSTLTSNASLSFKINVQLPMQLLNWTKLNPKSKLILTGSAAEYGLSKKKKIHEKTLLKPKSVYGFSKSLQSIYSQYHYLSYGTNFILLRLFNLKGKIFNNKLLIGKINNFIQMNKNKKSILHLGDLSSYRDYIDVATVARYIYRLAKISLKGEIINIGSGFPILVRDLVNESFMKHKNLRYIEISGKKNLSDPKYIIANVNKLKKILKNEKN